MILLAVVSLFLRATVISLIAEYDELEAEFWSLMQPATQNDDNAITVSTREQTVSYTGPRDRTRFREVSAKSVDVANRAKWCDRGQQISCLLLALLSLPLLASTYRSTTASMVRTRVLSLVVIPASVLFAAYSTDLIQIMADSIAQLKPLIVPLYPGLVLCVLLSVNRQIASTTSLWPVFCLAMIPVVLFSAYTLQPELPTSLTLQYSNCVVSAGTAFGCAIPYLRMPRRA